MALLVLTKGGGFCLNPMTVAGIIAGNEQVHAINFFTGRAICSGKDATEISICSGIHAIDCGDCIEEMRFRIAHGICPMLGIPVRNKLAPGPDGKLHFVLKPKKA